MSQQGPLIVVSTAPRPSFATALDDAQMFPVIDATWADASRAIEQVQPAAVLVAMAAVAEPGFEALAKQIAARKPYLLLIARGAAYPALSVSFGERMGIVGALSIEAAAKHLNIRDIDGIVLGEGF